MNDLTYYKERLEIYKKAERTILEGGQAYKIGTKSFTRSNLADITDMIKYLEKRVRELEISPNKSVKRKTMRVLFRDV